ncbi:hypothetical protein V1498_02930 [Peribacillus sp. SCS-26]|uniref:hypothetical protein n=1 Tax=Paraperibacillus marinus TaxID=3115295 RepID=UPI003906B3EF
MNHFFAIEGDKVSGKYVVTERINGGIQILFEINNRHQGGLKEARQMIGNYLKNKGHSLNEVFVHQCIKPGRKQNPIQKWTVEEYLFGVPGK